MIENALVLSKAQKKFIAEIRRRTGLDLDVENLQGMVDELKDLHTRAKQREAVSINNKEINGYDEFFDGRELKFADQEELDMLYSNLAINSSLLVPQKQLDAAYRGVTIDPQKLKDAIYGTGYSDPTSFDDVLNEYIDAKSKIENISQDNEELDLTKKSRKKASKNAIETAKNANF